MELSDLRFCICETFFEISLIIWEEKDRETSGNSLCIHAGRRQEGHSPGPKLAWGWG